ncbi:MAG: NrtA/SsuA/CpmA family ABC transporter substrate-binding protein [Deltaproteobacteria bacterium]|nr:NrtA/SsuA/CpmA family ABC transporter substrate-binding protein [Deltaproteobacteria bacterium]
MSKSQPINSREQPLLRRHHRFSLSDPGFWSACLALTATLLPLVVSAQTVRISYSGTSGQNVPLWVAHEAGLFKKQGLKDELVLISGGSTNMQAMLANEIQFSNTAGSTPIQAALQGTDIIIIASPYNFIPYSFVVRKDIHSAAELKGKTIAITRLGGITEIAARLSFEKLGLGPKDMTFIQAGPDAQRILAVQTGAVAATLVAPPALFKATALGLKVLVNLADVGIKYPVGVISARRSYIVKNRPLVKRFLMGFIEGLHVYVQKKEFSVGVMRKYTRIDDPEVLSQSHDYFAKSTAIVPFTDGAGVKTALAFDKASGKRAEELFDNSIVQELVDEGFVSRISKPSK